MSLFSNVEADIAGGRLRIPAFAGMTRYCLRGIVFCRAEPFGAPPAIVRGVLTKHSSFPRKTMRRNRKAVQILVIPAKAGICCSVSVRITAPILRAPPPDSRLRGNDEVLSASYCLLPRRTLRRSDRHRERRPYKHSSFPRKTMRRNRKAVQILVIPAKAGIRLRRFRKNNRADIAGAAPGFPPSRE